MEIKQVDVKFDRELFDNLGNVTDYANTQYTAFFISYSELTLLVIENTIREIKKEFKDLDISKLLYPDIIESEGGKVLNFEIKEKELEVTEDLKDQIDNLVNSKNFIDVKAQEVDKLIIDFQQKEFKLANTLNENKNTI